MKAKSLLCIVLAAMAILALCACQGNSGQSEASPGAQEEVTIESRNESASQEKETPAEAAESSAAPAEAQPSGGQAAPSQSETGDWLYASGNKIVDAQGREVWMTGVNWFGYNTGTNCPDGLWSVNMEELVGEVANRGFNMLRLPFSAELINQWAAGDYPEANINLWENKALEGKNSLEIFDALLTSCRQNGIKVMIDVHCTHTDAMGHLQPLWFDGDFSVEQYYSALAWMAGRYADNDTIIAYDLKNEPHGKAEEELRAIWNGSEDEANWRYVAQQAAQRVLEQNPSVLIVVEGVEIYPRDITENGDFASTDPADYYYNWWGGNLRGVADWPVDLGGYQNKLVYSAHDYGPEVYQQPWLEEGFTYQSLYEECWRDNWMFIHEQEIAPLFIGEWGGRMTQPNLTWMEYLRTLIGQNGLHHTFWCLNPNSGDTGGLLTGDFASWDEEKYAFVKEVLWQKDGQFIGLSADAPLGQDGLTRTEA